MLLLLLIHARSFLIQQNPERYGSYYILVHRAVEHLWATMQWPQSYRLALAFRLHSYAHNLFADYQDLCLLGLEGVTSRNAILCEKGSSPRWRDCGGQMLSPIFLFSGIMKSCPSGRYPCSCIKYIKSQMIAGRVPEHDWKRWLVLSSSDAQYVVVTFSSTAQIMFPIMIVFELTSFRWYISRADGHRG